MESNWWTDEMSKVVPSLSLQLTLSFSPCRNLIGRYTNDYVVCGTRRKRRRIGRRKVYRYMHSYSLSMNKLCDPRWFYDG